MDKIKYSIISRGELLVKYKEKSIRITGELTFDPPVFYADIISLQKIKSINEDEKKEMIDFITADSLETIGTKIVFD
ncbi:MAG: hypothetical protein ACK5ZY_12845 [Cyclobacteriaceae bacterium]|jgi:hypothetical protein